MIPLCAFMAWVGSALRFTFTIILCLSHPFLFPSFISIFFAPFLLPTCFMFSAFLRTTLFRIFLFLSPFSFLFCIDTFLISAARDTPDVADNSINVLLVVGRPRVQPGAVSWLNSLCLCLHCQLLRQASVCIIGLLRIIPLCHGSLPRPANPPPFAASFCAERYTQQFRFQRHYQ